MATSRATRDVPSESPLGTALRDFEGTRVTLFAKCYLDDDVMRVLRRSVSDAAGHEVELDLIVNPRMDAGAVLRVGPGRQVVLDPRGLWLADIEREVAERRESGELVSAESTYEFVRGLLEKTQPEASVEELLDVGSVLDVGDGVARVSGVKRVGSLVVVEFEGGVLALAFSLTRDEVGCILLGPEEGIREGGAVRRTGHVMRVPVGEALLGRLVNAVGEPIDGKGPAATFATRPVERKAPGVVERRPVDTPLHTGVKVIDSLVPLGRGQRELIIGDRKIGKTTLAIDTILSQKGEHVACIYVAIGQKATSVARVVRTLEEAGALEYTTIVVALPNEQPAFRYIAPYAGCAMGEYFMERGQDALIVYDDLSKHAVTYREMSALLKRPIGREAYPGDIFYLHSRLLERAARLSDERGGGSLTALPVIETLASDISAFIPTNVISICDGQIVLDTRLFNEGFRPAMDVGLSVSRVGGAAQTHAVKEVAGRLRIDISQYQEMAQFVKFGAEVDAATLAQLTRGERCREVLRQAQHAPMPPEHEVAVLFAVVNGLFDGIPLESLRTVEAVVLSHLDETCADLLERIRLSGELPAEDAERLTRAITERVALWGGGPSEEATVEEAAEPAGPVEESPGDVV